MKLARPTTKEWKHKSVCALMRAAGTNDPQQIVRSKARDLVAKAKAMGWSGPPFDPLVLASIRGIRHRKSSSLFTAEAQLVPISGNQLLLEFNPDRPSGRRNYTIGHEIAHTFFDDCYEMIHQRSTERKVFDPHEEVEHLCQVGASEIVMPYDEFLAEMAKLPQSLRAVFPLCDLFDVSREACSRRFLDLSSVNGVLVFLSKRNKPIELKENANGDELPEPKFRVLYTVGGQDFGCFFPKDKSVSDDSCLYSLETLDEIESGDEHWGIRGLGRCFVEAIRLPTPTTGDLDSGRPTVAALLRPA